jgi:ketosteroid isomerase-like protein
MKYVLCLLATFVLLAAGVNAQKGELSSILQNVVDNERAFSTAAEERGTREAFMAFIADDGVLFRPTAVNGKRWMRENPLPPSSKRPLLSWTPIHAEIAQAADMAYTTGPWEFKEDIKDAKPVAFGNFVTVWKKQADGSWKFVVDLGISNPQPVEQIKPWQLPEKMKDQIQRNPNVNIDTIRQELVKRDWEFSNDSQAKGTRDAFFVYAASDVRLFRNDSYPMLDRKSIKQALGASKDVWTFQPDYADVSRSGDLGYTYGTYELRTNDSAKTLTEKGNYLRIWRHNGEAWKVILDVANPIPAEKKS